MGKGVSTEFEQYNVCAQNIKRGESSNHCKLFNACWLCKFALQKTFFGEELQWPVSIIIK